MEVILKAGANGPRMADLSNRHAMPPPSPKAFMDDTTIRSNDKNGTRQVLKRLDKVVAASKKKFKPKKLRNMSIWKGKVDKIGDF